MLKHLESVPSKRADRVKGLKGELLWSTEGKQRSQRDQGTLCQEGKQNEISQKGRLETDHIGP